MPNIINQLKNVRVRLNGDDFDGIVDEFTPPQLEIMIQQYHAAGMDVPIDLDMGMHPLRGRLMINGYQPASFAAFGTADQTSVRMVVEGALEGLDADLNRSNSKITFDMRGSVTATAMGRVRGRGDLPRTLVNISCIRYQIFLNDTEKIVDINVLEYKREINGIDRLANLRTAISG